MLHDGPMSAVRRPRSGIGFDEESKQSCSTMPMPLISVDEDVERLVLGELLDYCESITGTNFDHQLMGAGEGLTILLAKFDLAKDTGAGFSGYLTGDVRETYLWSTDLGSLPSLEDLIAVCLSMANQYDRTPEASDNWKMPASFSGNLVAPLRKLELIDSNGFWTKTSIPIQLRSGFLRAFGDQGCPEANDLIARYADSSILNMPTHVAKALSKLDPFSPRYKRFACERTFADAWRFGCWLNNEQNQRCAPLGFDVAVHHVVDQILINRHNGKLEY